MSGSRREYRRERRGIEELPEPEILPMMNVLFMLVMVLMGMSAFLPIGVINVQAPQLGGGEGSASAAHQPELNLTIMILKTGFNLSAEGALLKGPDNQPLFPKIQTSSGGAYDFDGLAHKLAMIKAKHPKDTRVILMADPDIIYDDITHVMDAARPYFPEVAFVPGVVH